MSTLKTLNRLVFTCEASAGMDGFVVSSSSADLRGVSAGSSLVSLVALLEALPLLCRSLVLVREELCAVTLLEEFLLSYSSKLS